MLEAVEGRLCLLEAVEGELDLLEAVEGELCLPDELEVPEVLEALEAVRCVLLCILEAVEDGLCLPECDAPCAFSVCWRRWGVGPESFGVRKFSLRQFTYRA